MSVMIPDIGVTLGRLVCLALPPALNLPAVLDDLVAFSAETTAVLRTASAEVVNWRVQALTRLDLPTKTTALGLLGRSAAQVPRCIKLNNYWCVKRAGWQGELGADVEGHAAFETASAGVRAASVLLRRYYVDFGRRSAQAIVSRWAPNRCLVGGGPVTATRPLPTGPSLTVVRHMSQAEKDQTFKRLIAERLGIAEARHLMIERAISAAKGKAQLRSPGLTPTVRRATAGTPLTSGSPRPDPKVISHRIVPDSCALEAARIDAYARRSIEGITATVDEDLLLFDEKGVATWRLFRLMRNMSSVEIGPYAVAVGMIPDAMTYVAKTGVGGAVPLVRSPETDRGHPSACQALSGVAPKVKHRNHSR